MNATLAPLRRLPARQPLLFLLLAAAAWLGLYQALNPAAEALVAALPVERDSHLGGALQFFLYDTPKVLLLLTGIVFVMGMINSYFTPERTRAMLAGRTEGAANVMAASLGIVTPFCSCSAVPLFIGFVQAGVPLGVTFSFLISAPMVNEVALTLLFGLFGWKVALLYLGLGLTVAIVAGWVIGRLKMEAYLEDWVRDMPHAAAAAGDGQAHAGRAHRRRLRLGARDRRQGVAVHPRRHRHRRRHPRLRAGGFHGQLHGQGCLVGGAAGRADRRADVHQRGRRHPDRAGAARPRARRWARCSRS